MDGFLDEDGPVHMDLQEQGWVTLRISEINGLESELSVA